MAELGELTLWAALPLSALAAALSIAGGWLGRRTPAIVGGRAAEATSALLLVSVAGLGYALIIVLLKYAYVAAYTGFQDAWPTRLAALWSGPAGVALCLTTLIMLAAAISHRLDRTRSAVARTGVLATLGFIGLLVVVSRARPFLQPEAPALTGVGMPFRMATVGWQLEMWMAMLTTACAAFAFSGVIGEQLAERPGAQASERGAVRWAAAFMSLALLAAIWRAYSVTGRLLDATGLGMIAVHLPVLLLAFSYLHAPGGLAVPRWAARWRRVLGVALFPASLGVVVGLLSGFGGVPPVEIWGAGLAVGIISGSLAGIGRAQPGVEWLHGVPGFGIWAFQGALAALALTGALAIQQLVGGGYWADLGPTVILVVIAGACGWAVSRSAGGWRVWPTAVTFSVLSAVLIYFIAGRNIVFGLACGLAVSMAIGFAADLIRARAARRARGSIDDDQRDVYASRARRRWSSAIAHVGIASIVLGFSADGLTRTASGSISPGDSLIVQTTSGAVSAVYLGLSRYQTNTMDRRVASFAYYRDEGSSELVVASLSRDLRSGESFGTPALMRGAFRDVTLSVAALRGPEDILCSISARPLSNLVWLGGLLLFVAVVLVRRTEP